MKEQLIKLSIEQKRAAIEAGKQAREVFAAWGSRKWDKRLADKLKAVNKNLYLIKNKDWRGQNEWELQFYYENRYILSTEADSMGVRRAYYTKNTHAHLFYAISESAITPDKIETLINQSMEHLRRSIAEMQYTLKNCDKIKKQRAALIEKLNKLMEQTSFEACEYLNISNDRLYR